MAEHEVIGRVLSSPQATVYAVTKTINLFPYDLLLIASHCGDAGGYRWTYQFVDSEHLPREVIVDLAISPEFIPGKDEVRVTHFMKFVSLDGVDWRDEEAKSRMHIGTAMIDFMRMRQEDSLEPVKRETVERVHASMALGMDDGEFILTPDPFSSGHYPIVVNNACTSWHRLASDFVFKGARCYVGTLRTLFDVEAHDLTGQLFGQYYGHALATALWSIQNAMYPDPERRPYVLTGCHFQTLATHRAGSLESLEEELSDSLSRWQSRYLELDETSGTARTIAQMIEFLELERNSIRLLLRDNTKR